MHGAIHGSVVAAGLDQVARDTEVTKLTDQINIKKDVGRLQISMNNWVRFILVQKGQC